MLQYDKIEILSLISGETNLYIDIIKNLSCIKLPGGFQQHR